MANTVYGPYGKTNWVDHVTLGNQNVMNNLETQASVALHGINPDLSGPFVLSGCRGSKDGTIANQLDISSGVAYITLSDGTTGKIAVATDNTHTTSTASTTYYLYLQPNGTWYWSTSNSPAANSLPICTVATDGSGNISSVTDLRHVGGSPGVPVVVARALNVHVTSTVNQVLILVDAPVQGLYRASVAGTYGNATGGQKINVNCGWRSANGGGVPTAHFLAFTGGIGVQGEYLDGTQATGMSTNNDFSCAPITFYSVGGVLQQMFVQYQDPGGTPNDYVTAIIERLS